MGTAAPGFTVPYRSAAQVLTVLSSDPEASLWLSGLKATEETSSEKVRIRVHVSGAGSGGAATGAGCGTTAGVTVVMVGLVPKYAASKNGE
jgi:hypothetical protein